MSHRVSARSLLTIVAFVAVPVTVVAVLQGVRDQLRHRAEAEQQLLGLGEDAAAGIDQFMTYSERLLSGLAEDRHVVSLDPADCASHFPGIQNIVAPVFLSVDLWRADGTQLCSTLPWPDGAPDIGETRGFQLAMASDGFRVSEVFEERRTGRWSTALTYPVRGVHGERAMLSAVVDLLRFEEILLGLKLPEGAILSVMEREGVVVARSEDPEEWVGQRSPSMGSPIPDGSTTLRMSSTAASFEGVEYAWGVVGVPGSDWVVYAGLPLTVVRGTLLRDRIRLILVVLVLVSATSSLGVIVYRRATAPPVVSGAVGGDS